MAGIFEALTSLWERMSDELDTGVDVTADKLYPHVPSLVKYTDHRKPLPWTKNTTGVLMFADISGFTALCEKYCAQSAEGVDHLTTALNEYLGSLVELILLSEGDVLKFAGDAILAFWATSDGCVTSTVENVIKCCLDIQERCGEYDTDIGVTLTVKMGIAYGEVAFSFVGNNEFRHYVESGPAVDDVKLTQAHCHPREVVITSRAWRECDHRKFRFVRTHDRKHVRVISTEAVETLTRTSTSSDQDPDLRSLGTVPNWRVSNPCTTSEPPAVQDASVNTRKSPGVITKLKRAVGVLGSISKSLRLYVLPPVLDKLDDGQPLEYLSEMRQISVVFINLTLDELSNTTDLMQALFETVYQHVHSLQGCLNKIFLFDKGCSFLVIFGLPGSKDEHDRAYALQCAVAIAGDLRTENGVRQVSIGVTTGTAFCGVVGHKNRHEYSVIGRKVNMAARLMMYYPGEITFDDNTFHGSDLTEGTFRVVSTKVMKGLQTTETLRQLVPTTRRGSREQLHAVKHFKNPILDREEEMAMFSKILGDMKLPSNRAGQTETMVIEGDSGMGKTRLLDAMTSQAEEEGARIVRCPLNMDDVNKPYSLARMLLYKIVTNACSSDDNVSEEDAILDGLRRNHMLKYLPFVNLIMEEKGPNLHGAVTNNEGLITTLHAAINSVVRKILMDSRLTVFAIDDIHFADPDSLNLLVDMQQQQQHNVMIILTTRPPQMNHKIHEGYELLLASSTTTKLRIEGLKMEYLRDLACQMMQVSRIPSEIHDVLVKKSGGCPAWCEHLLQDLLYRNQLQIVRRDLPETSLTSAVSNGDVTDAFRKSSVGEEAILNIVLKADYDIVTSRRKTDTALQLKSSSGGSGEWICVIHPDLNPTDLMIPESIKDMMVAKLDRLRASEQMLVKCASVLGVTFYRQILTQLLPNHVKTKRLDFRIGNLLEAGIFVCGQMSGHKDHVTLLTNNEETGLGGNGCQCSVLSFQNPILQETVYGMLLEKQRKSLHRSAASLLDAWAKRHRNDITRNLIGHASDNPHLAKVCCLKSSTGEYKSDQESHFSFSEEDEPECDLEINPSKCQTSSLRVLILLCSMMAYHWRCAKEYHREFRILLHGTSASLALGQTIRADSMLRAARDVLSDIEKTLIQSQDNSYGHVFVERLRRKVEDLQTRVNQQKLKAHDTLLSVIDVLRLYGQWYPVNRRAATIALSWKLKAVKPRQCCHKHRPHTRAPSSENIPGDVCDQEDCSDDHKNLRKNSTLLDAFLQLPQRTSMACCRNRMGIVSMAVWKRHKRKQSVASDTFQRSLNTDDRVKDNQNSPTSDVWYGWTAGPESADHHDSHSHSRESF